MAQPREFRIPFAETTITYSTKQKRITKPKALFVEMKLLIKNILKKLSNSQKVNFQRVRMLTIHTGGSSFAFASITLSLVLSCLGRVAGRDLAPAWRLKVTKVYIMLPSTLKY